MKIIYDGSSATGLKHGKRARNKAAKRQRRGTKPNRSTIRKKAEKETGVYHAWYNGILMSLGLRIDSDPRRPKIRGPKYSYNGPRLIPSPKSIDGHRSYSRSRTPWLRSSTYT